MSDEEEGGEGGGGGNKMVIIIVAVLILLIAGGAAAFFLMGGDDEEELEEEVIEDVSASAEPLAEPQFLVVGEFVANIRDGRRYLKTSIQLMLSEAAAMEYLNLRLVEVKDVVLSELQSLTIEDINQPGGKEALKQQLILKSK